MNNLAPPKPPLDPSVQEALQQARRLRDAGGRQKAEEIWKGLETLYRDDASAAEVFQAPVRIGTPTGTYGLTDQISTPAFAASVGLLKWGLEQEFEPARTRGGVPLSGIGSAVTNWLRNFLP